MTRCAAVLAAALLAAACDAEDPFEIPTSPTPPTIYTETFSGTISRNGAQTHPFNTQASGRVTVTLTALAPDNTVQVGLALGTWNGSACQLVITKDDAVESDVVTGDVSTLGSLCVRVYDAGALTGPTDYEVEVVHP